MKKLLVLCAIVAIVWLPASPAAAKWYYEATKEKRISKHYNVQAGDKLRIENTFGKVHINTWDKNEVTVDITITVKAKSDEKAESMLDKVQIDERNEDHILQYRTEVGNMTTRSNNNASFEIDYVINMPRRNPLEVLNKFGDVYLANFDAALKMEVNYGALRTEKLIGPDVRIRVSFGSANIERIETGRINISYSKLVIGTAGEIEVVNKFGQSDITTVRRLRMDQQYGDIDIESADEVTGDVQFANLRIDKLNKHADIGLKYCNKANFDMIGKDVDVVRVKGSFSNMHFNFDKDASLSVVVDTRFGNLRSGPYDMYSNSNDEDRDRNTRKYKGKIGAGKGNMAVDASYGDVVFGR